MNPHPLPSRGGLAALAALLLAAAAAPGATFEFHSFSPPAAPLGHEVILRGRGLTNVTAVTFHGVGAPFRLLHDGALAARVPAGRVDGPVTLWAGLAESAAVPGFRRTHEPLSVVVWDAFSNNFTVPDWLQPPVNLTNAVDVAVASQSGSRYGLAARADGSLVVWGRPQLQTLTNVPPEAQDIVAVSAMPNHWLALRRDGEVIRNPAWDQANPRPETARELVAVSAGASGVTSEFVGLREDGTVVHVLSPRSTAGEFNGLSQVTEAAYRVVLRRDGEVSVGTRFLSPRLPSRLVQVGGSGIGISPTAMALHRDGRIGSFEGSFFRSSGLSNFVALSRGVPLTTTGIREDGTVVLDVAGLGSRLTNGVPPWLTGVRTLHGYGAYFIALAALPPRFTAAPEDAFVPVGGTVRLAAEVAGTGPFRLRWYKDGVAIPGANRPVLEFADAEIFDDGEYSCVATGPHGVAGSLPARVRVILPPAVTGLVLAADGTVTLEGVNLAAVTAVTFNGVGAFPLRAAAGRLELRPPAGNTAGPIRVWIGNTAYAAPDNVRLEPPGRALVRWLHLGPDEPDNFESDGEAPAAELLAYPVQVAVRGGETAVLRRDGRIVLWSGGAPAQVTGLELGENRAVRIARYGLQGVIALRREGQLVALGGASTNLFLRGPSADGLFVTVEADGGRVIALRPDGQVAVWGDALSRALPADLQPARAAVAAGNGLAVLERDGRVVAWGSGSAVQRLSPPAGVRFTALAYAGGFFALGDQGGVWRWSGSQWQAVPGAATGVTGLEGGARLVATRASGPPLLIGPEGGLKTAPAWLGPAVHGSASNTRLLALRSGPPVLVGEPEELTLAPSALAELTARPETGQLDLRFAWLSNGVPMPGATGAVLRAGVQGVSVLEFDVVASSAAGSATQRVARVRTAAGGPVLASVTPAAAAAGALVRFTGANFATVTAVTFNGHAAWFRVLSDTELEARVPNRPATGEVGLWSHDRRLPTGCNFTLLASPGEAVSWGLGGTGLVPPPELLTNVLHVRAVPTWSLAAQADGATRLWGTPPEDVPAELTNVVTVAGSTPAVLVDTAGRVQVVRGQQGAGVLRLSDLTDALDAVAFDRFRAVLRRDGRVQVEGIFSADAVTLPDGWERIVALAAGNRHLLGLRADGRVLAWGRGWRGEAEVPPALGRAVAVTAQANASGALATDGRALLWGQDGRREAAFGGEVVALEVGARFTGAVLADGSLALQGRNESGQLFPPPGLRGVTALSLGPAHGVALGGFAPRIVADPRRVTAVAGQPGGVTLSVRVAGTGPLHYRWRHGGVPLPDTDAAALTLPAEPGRAGWYAVEIGNPFGTVLSPPAEVRLLGRAVLGGLRVGASGSLHAALVRDGAPGWEALPGGTVVAEVSEDLRTWRPETFSLDASGRLVIAPDFHGPAARFFRVREE
jgi:hypothetical protein